MRIRELKVLVFRKILCTLLNEWYQRVFALRIDIFFLKQVEFHPHLIQEDLLKFCREHDIFFQAYSSLGTGEVSLTYYKKHWKQKQYSDVYLINYPIAKLLMSDKGFGMKIVYISVAMARRYFSQKMSTMIGGYHANWI